MRGSGLELVVHPCNRASDTFLDDVRGFVVRQKLFGVVMPPSVSEDDRVIEILKEVDCPLCPHRLGVAGRAGLYGGHP